MIFGLLALAASTGTAYADNSPPGVPDNVAAASVSSSAVRVSWNRPSDDTGVAGFNIYRDGSYRATVFDTHYVDYGVSSGETHTYSVVAFDAARNYTVGSATSTVTVGSGSAGTAPTRSSGGTPAAPNNLRSESAGGGLRVSWSSGGGDVAGYNVYRDGSYLTTVRATDHVDSQLDAGREYRYNIVAFSGESRFSGKSRELVVRAEGGNSQRALAVSDDAGQSGTVPGGYRLVFSDEFNGSSVDGSKWNTRYRWGPNWIINNERQYYVDRLANPDFGHSPLSFDGSNMVISAIRTPDHLRSSANSQPWLSGAMTTYNKFRMRYGYVEMRAQLPRGQGLWPAFWLLHQNDNERRPEIDVVEMLGRDPNVVYQTYHHFENYNLRSTPSYQARGADYSSGFHTYGMRWEPGRVIWYVDGRETNRYENGNVSSEDMYLLLNLAVGGQWSGEPNDNTPSPSQFKIDYVRAYQG